MVRTKNTEREWLTVDAPMWTCLCPHGGGGCLSYMLSHSYSQLNLSTSMVFFLSNADILVLVLRRPLSNFLCLCACSCWTSCCSISFSAVITLTYSLRSDCSVCEGLNPQQAAAAVSSNINCLLRHGGRQDELITGILTFLQNHRLHHLQMFLLSLTSKMAVTLSPHLG